MVTDDAVPRQIELDHVFVMSDIGAPEGEALLRLGAEEMPPNAHPGQGTACRRFSLGAQYLELLWVCDEDEAQSHRTRPTRLWERWVGRRAGTCPFGLVFRSHGRPTGVPFRTWSYSPSYLPPGVTIEVAHEAPSSGPAIFWLPFISSRPERRPARVGGETLDAVTGLRIGGPDDEVPPSDALRWAQETGTLSFESSRTFHLTVVLDGGRGGHRASLAPRLPLTFEW